MWAECRAEWYEPLLDSMLLRNQSVAELVDEFDILGVTDVTGFGLAGHLLEMLTASNKAAELTLSALPLLPGVRQLSGGGFESTLARANRAAETEIEVAKNLRNSHRYAALFDPQTSGGLLLGVLEKDVDTVLNRLRQQSGIPAAVIGRTTKVGEGRRIHAFDR